MSTSCVNYWAVVVGAVVYFILGALWYSKGLFGKSWMQNIGKTEDQLKAAFSPWKLVWTFIGSFLAAYGLARVMSWIPEASVSTGIMVGILAGVCFVFAPMSINDTMESRPCKLTSVNILYHMVGFVLMGIIIGAWR
ncbi:MAG: DUF1761 domain-containing protein [candidate division Zixibacteria bacterium]|nr:DUF1761 domain-containing protein [candidate division Zixibacteria bacterium]